MNYNPDADMALDSGMAPDAQDVQVDPPGLDTSAPTELLAPAVPPLPVAQPQLPHAELRPAEGLPEAMQRVSKRMAKLADLVARATSSPRAVEATLARLVPELVRQVQDELTRAQQRQLSLDDIKNKLGDYLRQELRDPANMAAFCKQFAQTAQTLAGGRLTGDWPADLNGQNDEIKAAALRAVALGFVAATDATGGEMPAVVADWIRQDANVTSAQRDMLLSLLAYVWHSTQGSALRETAMEMLIGKAMSAYARARETVQERLAEPMSAEVMNAHMRTIVSRATFDVLPGQTERFCNQLRDYVRAELGKKSSMFPDSKDELNASCAIRDAFVWLSQLACALLKARGVRNVTAKSIEAVMLACEGPRQRIDSVLEECRQGQTIVKNGAPCLTPQSASFDTARSASLSQQSPGSGEAPRLTGKKRPAPNASSAAQPGEPKRPRVL